MQHVGVCVCVAVVYSTCGILFVCWASGFNTWDWGYIDKARQGGEGGGGGNSDPPPSLPSRKDTQASSAAAGLCRWLGSFVPVQLYGLGELVVKLHLGLLKSDESSLAESLRGLLSAARRPLPV